MCRLNLLNYAYKLMFWAIFTPFARHIIIHNRPFLNFVVMAVTTLVRYKLHNIDQ